MFVYKPGGINLGNPPAATNITLFGQETSQVPERRGKIEYGAETSILMDTIQPAARAA